MSTENLFSYHHLRYSCLFVQEMLSVDDFATLKATHLNLISAFLT
jgi:hypothetical protein